MFFVYGICPGRGGRKHSQLLGAVVDEDTAKRRAAGWFVHLPFECVYVENSLSGVIHFFRCTALRKSHPQSAEVLPLRPGLAPPGSSRRRCSPRTPGQG